MTVPVRSLFARAVVVLGLASFAMACRSKPTTDTNTDAPLPSVSAKASDLLLTWIDERGEFHVEQSVDAVPADAREVVRVVEPSRHALATGEIFIADLRTASPDGTYPVHTMPREAFEALAVERRKRDGGTVLTPQLAEQRGTGDDAKNIAMAKTVLIYGASWCGPCHQVQAYLKGRGIPFIEKDIEADPNAAREMHAKLASAGRAGGSIPVIDIQGRILIGFDPAAIDRALAAR